jgi:ankyrin repeat protein
MTQSLCTNKVEKNVMRVKDTSAPEDYTVALDYAKKYGKKALIKAAGSESQSVLRVLLDAGADINAKGKYNPTSYRQPPLHAGFNPPIRYEYKYIGTPLVAAIYKGNFANAQFLFECGADIEKKGWRARAPLTEMILVGDLDRIKALLDFGADVNTIDDNGNSPLLALVRRWLMPYKRWSIIDPHYKRERLPILNLLLQYNLEDNLDINKQDKFGWTALHYAAKYGCREIVQKLLEARACSIIKNKRGKTAVDVARKEGHREIVELIEGTSLTDGKTTKAAR